MRFIFGQVVSFISDSAGRVVELAKTTDVVGGLSTWVGNRLKVQATIVGKDGAHELDIQLIDGAPSVRTFGIQAIESLRGFDPQADVWFYIGTELDSVGVGDEGDEITVTILAGDDPVAFPAISIVYTLTAGDAAGDEDNLSLNIAAFLNTQSPFKDLWRAQRVSGSGVVYITTRKPGGQYERSNTNDFDVSATGATVVTRAFDKIIRRNKITGLARDPADPRQGQLGIQGSVSTTEGDVTSRFFETFNLAVNGSGTPVEFVVMADPVEVKFITRILFHSVGNGIKFGNFLSKNSALTNGIELDLKSKDSALTFPSIKVTEDFNNNFAIDPSKYKLEAQAGGDYFSAALIFTAPLEIRPEQEFTLDDFFRITVNDNLNTGLTSIGAEVVGFTREF